MFLRHGDSEAREWDDVLSQAEDDVRGNARSYTVSNAYAAFEENLKGTLAPGKLADITVLSKDILTCPDDEIRSTKVMHTIVGGKVLYSAK